MASNDKYHMFVYDLPYNQRRNLCAVLDRHNTWKELAGIHMEYDVRRIEEISRAELRDKSPTDVLLYDWGTQNHTVRELFILLSKMQHYEAMSILKPLVNPEYHCLIFEGEENFSKITPQHNDDHQVVNPKHGAKDVHGLSSNVNYVKTFQNKVALPETKISNLAPTTPEPGPSCEVGEQGTPVIPYSELEKAADGWSKKSVLGKGGFGTVYKGIWKNTQVAIKRFEVQKRAEQDDMWKTQREQSLREIKYLTTCRHDNILPIYGYSIEGPYHCLVYQYMPNGTLEDRLQCRDGRLPLSWSQRHNIAVGTARGIQYLHNVGDKPLVHGDIKSANILLDPSLEPKIGDFGLAREGQLENCTHVTVSRVHGTRPYLPDEFLRSKKFSTKVDTFSFGIVLFELATGLRAYDESTRKTLKDEIESHTDDTIHTLIDVKAGADGGYSFTSLITLGKCCVKTRPKDRPEMVLVLESLEMVASTSERLLYAQYLAGRNCLQPSSPYEWQVVHDNRKPTMSQNRSPLLGRNGFQFPASRSDAPLLAGSLIGSGHPPVSVATYSTGLTNPSATDNKNERRIPVAIAAPAQLASPVVLPTPAVAVQPPSANLTELLPDLPNNSQLNELHEDDLPLISELGIKSD